MATFKAQVESLVGTVTDTTGLDVWLTEAAKMLSNLIPEGELHRYASATTTTTYQLSLTGKRVLSVRKGSWPAYQVPLGWEGKVTDTNSLHYAQAHDPKFIIATDVLYVYPAATPEASVLVYSYPSVANTDSAIASFPDELEPAVVRWAAMMVVLKKIYDVVFQSYGSHVWAGPVTPPSAPLASSLAWTTVIGQNPAATTVGSFPLAPTYTPPTLDLTTPYGELDTALDTEEDVEQAQAKINEIQARIGEYQAKVQNGQIAFQASYVTWEEEVKKAFENARLAQEKILTEAKLDLDVEQLNAIKTLEADVTEYQQNLTRYQIQVQGFVAEVQDAVAEFANVLERMKAQFVGYSDLYKVLASEYDLILQMYLKTIGAQK